MVIGDQFRRACMGMARQLRGLAAADIGSPRLTPEPEKLHDAVDRNIAVTTRGNDMEAIDDRVQIHVGVVGIWDATTVTARDDALEFT
jgi:hypothetical protein